VSSLEAALEPRSLRARAAKRATLALLGLFILGVAAIWAAPRPRMIDLPQHAGQIALLHDLILGRSPWAGEIRINLATPYLIGYGLALPLSFLMPAGAALKTVLTAAYAGFIAACLGIRRELGASPKLDAYYAFSFFGFAYGWGMFTFLVAAPVGLAFIWLCIRYARGGRGLRQGLGVAALGLALLLSHGLVFLFAGGLGGLILLVRATSLRGLVVRSWPFWLLLAACAAIAVLTRERETALTPAFASQVHFGAFGLHLRSIVGNAFDAPARRWPIAFFAIFAGLPLLGGFRPDWRAREAVVILAATLAALAFAPHYAWSTSMLFERFAIFLPPAYAWVLRERPPAAGSLAVRLQPHVALVAGLACAAVLAQHARLALAFGREQRSFETVLSAAAPGERALALIFDAASEVDDDDEAYLHHALWYQADRHGFVDFNFAAFHPQIARFRPGRIPPAGERLAMNPQQFDWRANGGDRYRYIFVRSDGPPPARALAGAPCPPALVAAAGKWRLYERRASCAAP